MRHVLASSVLLCFCPDAALQFKTTDWASFCHAFKGANNLPVSPPLQSRGHPHCKWVLSTRALLQI